jgi:lipoate-protein ligase A
MYDKQYMKLNQDLFYIMIDLKIKENGIKEIQSLLTELEELEKDKKDIELQIEIKKINTLEKLVPLFDGLNKDEITQIKEYKEKEKQIIKDFIKEIKDNKV